MRNSIRACRFVHSGRVLLFVVAGLLFLLRSETANAQNVNLQACGPQAIVPWPGKVIVAYWTTAAGNDTQNWTSFDLSFAQNLIGTPYNGDVTQYYEFSASTLGSPSNDCNFSLAEPYVFNDLQNRTGGVIQTVLSPVPPTTPISPGFPVGSNSGCPNELSVVDSIASQYGSGNLIILQLGPGVVESCNTFCAYHNITGNGNAYITLPYVTNANIAQVNQNFSNLNILCETTNINDYMSVDLGHEIGELLTDPDLKSGWMEFSGAATEIGDQCQASLGYQWQEALLVPGIPAAIQPLWSNHSSSCVFSYAMDSANFYLGGDGQIWEQATSQTSAVAWGRPATPFTTAPSVASWGPRRYDLFAYNSARHLGHIYQYPNGSGVTIGSDDWLGPPSGLNWQFRPAVTSWGNSRLDIFATVFASQNNEVLHRSWDNRVDSLWRNIGSPTQSLRSSPAAVSWGYGEVDVFVVGSDSNLYHASSSDGRNFSGWTSLGQPGGGVTLTGDPAAASWGPGRLDVFLVNSVGGLSHYWYDHGQHGWNPFPLPPGVSALTGSPTAASMGDQRVLAIGTTTSGAFAEMFWDFGNYYTHLDNAYFAPVGNASAVASVARAPDSSP